MNLWIKKTGLILGLALFLFACEEPGEIGLELDPDVGNFVGAYAEIPLKTSTIKASPYYITKLDSTLRADTLAGRVLRRTGAFLLGKYEDEYFGKTTISAYTQLVPLTTNDRIPSNTTLLGLEMTLYLSNFHFDESALDAEQNFTIYELTEDIDTTNFSNTSYEYSDQIGQFNFSLEEIKETKTLTITLNEDLGERFLEDLQDTTIAEDDKAFVEYFKGLAYIPSEENNMLFRVNPLVNSRVDLIYKEGNDTSKFTMVMDGLMSQNVETDFSGTELAGAANDEPLETNMVYLNATSGIVGELDFSPFFDFADSVGPMVINRAEISIDTIHTQNYINNPGAINLFSSDNSVFDIRELAFYDPQQSSNNPPRINGVFFDDIPGLRDTVNHTIRYTALFTNITNQMLANDLEEFKLLFSPSSYGRVPNQLFFEKNKLKLKLYYSHIK